jgi:hypothetical protein
MTLAIDLMFLASIGALGALSIAQALRGQVMDVITTNAIVTVLIWLW